VRARGATTPRRLTPGSPGAFQALVALLAGGGTAIVPCDTMYGLVGRVPGTEAALRRIKGRGEQKAFLLLVPDVSWLPRVASALPPQRLARHWPGPLTVVLPARAGGTVAVRVPDSPFLLRLMEAVSCPLYSTSVNRAGQEPIAAVADMCREFEADVGMVRDAGDLPPGAPSTLVDTTTRPCRVLRQGALYVPAEDLA
jgi:L-threonylcarbamoyladenylate synthase